MIEFMRHKIIYYFLTLLSILACSTSTWCIYFMDHIVNVTLYFIYRPNHYNKKPKQNMHMFVWTHDQWRIQRRGCRGYSPPNQLDYLKIIVALCEIAINF
jgi:hypothetical protein